MFILLFIVVLVCDLFEWKRIDTCFLSFVYVCLDVGDTVIKRGRLRIH